MTVHPIRLIRASTGHAEFAPNIGAELDPVNAYWVATSAILKPSKEVHEEPSSRKTVNLIELGWFVGLSEHRVPLDFEVCTVCTMFGQIHLEAFCSRTIRTSEYVKIIQGQDFPSGWSRHFQVEDAGVTVFFWPVFLKNYVIKHSTEQCKQRPIIRGLNSTAVAEGHKTWNPFWWFLA